MQVISSNPSFKIYVFNKNFMQTIPSLPNICSCKIISSNILLWTNTYPTLIFFIFLYNYVLIISYIWLENCYPNTSFYGKVVKMHRSDIPRFLQQCNIIGCWRNVYTCQYWIMLSRSWKFCHNLCIWSILEVCCNV